MKTCVNICSSADPNAQRDMIMRGGTANPNVSWKHWYALTRWQKRRRHQLHQEPYCKLCLERGVLTAAEVVDHVKSHGGDWNAFWLTPLQSLCKACHDGPKQWTDRKGYDPHRVDSDGWPADPAHPANKVRPIWSSRDC
jgi:5-methylcytosine-specific restriction endonuclease McrA